MERQLCREANSERGFFVTKNTSAKLPNFTHTSWNDDDNDDDDNDDDDDDDNDEGSVQKPQ